MAQVSMGQVENLEDLVRGLQSVSARGSPYFRPAVKIEGLNREAKKTMANVRKNHTTEFKAKVAVEAIRQQKTINELTAEYGVRATQINLWKKQALAAIPETFSGKKERAQDSQQQDIDELHRQIAPCLSTV